MKKTILTLFATLVIALTSAANGQANVERAFVSIAGDDQTACTQTSPCRTFAGALLKVFDGGEIVAVDSGIYGNIQIDKSVTIQGAPGVYAVVGVDLKVGTAVTIAAPADARVVLRNLHITTDPHMVSQMLRGIDFLSGGSLHVENCVVSGFKDFGIRFNLDQPSCDVRCPQLSVKDSFVRDNSVGIAIRSAALIEHSRIEGNDTGVQLGGNSQVTIRDSIVATNRSHGLTVAFLSTARVESCSFTDNGKGLMVLGYDAGAGSIYVSNSLISGNKVGLAHQNGLVEGKIFSFRNNRVFGNDTDGDFDQVLTQQ